MIKLIKLCFVCCLIFRATFVEADYQNYKEYIEELKELEERYRNVDKTIDLSGHTMREVVKRLHDILQTRAHSKIGTSQEQDSYPALLKVNDNYYELYFHGTKNQPGNCMLKRKGEKPKPWLKSNGEYNSALNTDENYIEQNLMLCLEIARRKLCCDTEGNAYDIFYDTPILEVIVIGLNLVNNQKECPTFSFFGCFTGDSRMAIAESFKKQARLDDRALGKLKLEFYNKRIDDKVIQSGREQYFKNDLSSFVKNGKVVEKLIRQNFTYCEPIGNLKWDNEKISLFTQLEFKTSNESDKDSIYKSTLKAISRKFNDKHPVYILDGNATKNFVKFLAPKNIKKKTKLAEKQIKKGDVDSVESLCKKHFEKGFVFLHATGEGDITRWFYLDKSNGTMYLLSETPKP